MKPLRDIRVIPVVVVAIAGLAVLKIAGLVLDGGYVFDSAHAARKSLTKSWAQDNLNFPGGRREEDITGSVHGGAPTEKKEEKKDEAPKPDAPETKPEVEAAPPISASERAILERLQARRQELDARAREIDIRESLLKAAEKRIEEKSADLKATEARVTAASGQKDEAESARMKNIVTMYEAMKPKDAAKVFDRLEMGVLIEIAVQIKPQKMSDIMGLMQPEAAERLTVEMARRAGADKSAAAVPDLPKIEGKVTPVKPN